MHEKTPAKNRAAHVENTLTAELDQYHDAREDVKLGDVQGRRVFLEVIGSDSVGNLAETLEGLPMHETPKEQLYKESWAQRAQ